MTRNLIYGYHTSVASDIGYEYDATWRSGATGPTWSASVRIAGRHARHLTGIMHSADAAAGAVAVHAAIEKAIERTESPWQPALIERRVSAAGPQRAGSACAM